MDPLKVLVIDDELGIRMGVARALRDFCVRLPELDEEDHCFEVLQAGSGEEGLDVIRSSKPDILLLDLKLPGISGLDVLKGIQEGGNEDILTVMITAYATIETAVTATKRGAHDILPKPFTPQELKAVVAKSARHLLARRKAAKLAAEKRQLRFQFISVLAHELKAPLAAIEGYLYILGDRSLGDDMDAYDHVIERTVVRAKGMRKLVMDLLDLTRIESGQKKRVIEPANVIEAARSAIETAQPSAEPRGITIDLHTPEDLWIQADAGELEIVFNNLVSNAVKYNRDGGRVDITVTPTDDGVALRVQDTGIGMSEAERKKLFQEFVRIKNDKTRTILGSGLGLTILKKIASLYDGEIAVESAPDVGSTFTVTLKADRATPPAEGAS